MTKTKYNEVKVKELVANPEIQTFLKKAVEVPTKVIVKSVRNPFKNEETNETTQKVHAVAGTSLVDMMEFDFTLVNQSIDGTEAINKEFQIVEYSFALEANMRGGNFGGYSPTGLKLLITKLIPVTNEGK
ncbi:hypothetical protein LYY41_001689 [Enterococcus faecalis]|uniref:Phage protein n=1 Tax=Enterococcus sulfureus ATCC 49903 TaxID=1140003 RepID=S0L1A8_9ENTE|nr:hypothetical protein [Enterococcus sulfureus]EGO5081054.1 hypothetical protein [Enterococcus faecalis]EGO6123682.1 hypothetical protein [Enterococcus faecalis]EGO7587763.1 hypothetical protein [Enterococcus faecalis]EGO7950291.1 hypothetical protein [Enterococcus faecalis]EGO8662142.1 hypothetical protein [Enterococcus faecalis]